MTTPTDLATGTGDETTLLPWLARMRDEQPVRTDGHGVRHVFRHADVVAVTRDPVTFSSDTARLVPGENNTPPGAITQLDPPEHRELRRLVGTAFTPRAVAALEPRIRTLTARLLDAAGENFDFVESFAAPLPVTVIAELLGLPESDHDRFRGWAEDLFSLQVDDPTDPEIGNRIAASLGEINAYLLEQVEHRRRHPGEDVLSGLVTAEADGRKLDDAEAAGVAGTLLLAGHLTTTVLLGNTVRTLDEHPRFREHLRADQSLIPATIEEVLRYRAPFAHIHRVTTRETELAGTPVPAGVVVTSWITSANRDPRVHTDPDSFDPLRTAPAGHAAFGHGIHFCLGAPLARLETRIAVEEILRRHPTLRVDHHATDGLRPYGSGVLGTRTLPVTTTASE